MTTTAFDASGDLILIDGRVSGPNGQTNDLNLVLDTGSSQTIICPAALDVIGYTPRMGKETSAMRSPIGVERGYSLRVARLQALGFEFDDFEVHAHELEGFGVDGILGLTFLRNFDLEIQFRNGVIRAERAPVA